MSRCAILILCKQLRAQAICLTIDLVVTSESGLLCLVQSARVVVLKCYMTMLMVQLFQKLSTILMMEGCFMHFIISISLRTDFFFYSVFSLNLGNILTTRGSWSVLLVQSRTFAQPPQPNSQPIRQLPLSGRFNLTDGNLTILKLFFFCEVSMDEWLNLIKVLLKESLFIIFQQTIAISKYSMSFILQRIGSGSSLASDGGEVDLKKSNIYSFKRPSIVNAKDSSQTEWKIIIFSSLKFFANVMLVVLSFMMGKFESIQDQELLQYLSSIFAGCSAIFFIMEEINQYKIWSGESFSQISWSIGGSIKIILSVVFYLIHPNYFLGGIRVYFLGGYYDLDSLLSVIVYFRIFSVISFLLQISKFYGLRVSRVLDIYAVKDKHSIGYAFRCLFKVNGLKTPLFMVFFGLLIISFINVKLKRVEDLTQDFLQELYKTVIAMTTVGYGDILIDSIPLGVTTVIVIILGSFTSSVLTLTVLNFFTLNQKEQKAYSVQNRLRLRQKIREQENRIVSEIIYNRKFRKGQGKSNVDSIKPALSQYKNQLNEQEINEPLVEFFTKNHNELKFGIKKLVQKQLIIKNLMSFYIDRMSKQKQWSSSTELKEEQNPKSQKSCQSKKRADDSKRIMDCFEMIMKES